MEDLIVEEGLHVISAAPGDMKSMLTLFLSNVMSTGESVCWPGIQPREVVYVDRENPANLIRERYDLLKITDERQLRYWGMWCHQQPPAIGSEPYMAWAEERKPVFVFDSLVRFHDREENDASAMRWVMGFFRDLTILGATVILHPPQRETRLGGRFISVPWK